MRGGVDEVGEADEGGTQADCGPVESGHEDLGVGVKGLGDVQVVGDERLEPLLVGVDAGLGSAGDGDISTAGICLLASYMRQGAVDDAYALKKRPLPVRTVMKTSSRLATSRMSCERRK